MPLSEWHPLTILLLHIPSPDLHSPVPILTTRRPLPRLHHRAFSLPRTLHPLLSSPQNPICTQPKIMRSLSWPPWSTSSPLPPGDGLWAWCTQMLLLLGLGLVSCSMISDCRNLSIFDLVFCFWILLFVSGCISKRCLGLVLKYCCCQTDWQNVRKKHLVLN